MIQQSAAALLSNVKCQMLASQHSLPSEGRVNLILCRFTCISLQLHLRLRLLEFRDEWLAVRDTNTVSMALGIQPILSIIIQKVVNNSAVSKHPSTEIARAQRGTAW